MRIITIKKRKDFLAIRKGRVAHSNTIILAYGKTPERHIEINQRKRATDFVRFGLTVSKKMGNAVVRNRIKRQLREIIRGIDVNILKNHTDYNIISKKDIVNADFSKIKKDLLYTLLKK